MGFATGYQAGIRTPSPYDDILDRAQRERESERTAGIQQYVAQTGRMRFEAGESRLDREARTRTSRTAGAPSIRAGGAEDFYSYYPSDRPRPAAEKEALDRAAAEKISARKAGVSQYKAETGRITAEAGAESVRTATGISKEGAAFKAQKRDWFKKKKKDQDLYDNATSEILMGNVDAASEYFLQHFADVKGIDLKGTSDPTKNVLAIQKILGEIPKITKTENGVSILFPGKQEPAEFSTETFMGQYWGPQNPKHRTQTLEEAAEVKKTEAETREIGRPKGLSEKDALAREKFEFEKRKTMIDYPELATGEIAKDYYGGPADSAEVSIPTPGPGERLQYNKTTRQYRVVPMAGGGGGAIKKTGITKGPADLEKIKRSSADIKAYLDAHPIEQAAQPVPPRTGVKEPTPMPPAPTPNVSAGVAPDRGEATFTNVDIARKIGEVGGAGIDYFRTGMDEATGLFQEAAARRTEDNYAF